jgi:hypothetical protein
MLDFARRAGEKNHFALLVSEFVFARSLQLESFPSLTNTSQICGAFCADAIAARVSVTVNLTNHLREYFLIIIFNWAYIF